MLQKGRRMIATSYPLLDAFLTMLWIFLFIIWIWLLIMVFADIFRSRDLSGWSKAIWVVGIIIFPLLGVLIYLIARGAKMHERQIEAAQAQQAAFGTMSRRPQAERGPPISWPNWRICATVASSPRRSSSKRRPKLSAADRLRRAV